MVLISGTFALQAKQKNQAWEAHFTASRYHRWQCVKGFGSTEALFASHRK